jgi:transposase
MLLFCSSQPHRPHHSAVLKLVSSPTLLETAKRLGLTQGRVLVAERAEEMTLVFDLAIYTAKEGRSRALDRYARATSPALGSDEALILSRLRQLDQRIGLRFAIATDSQRCGMSGKSPVSASEDQRAALAALAGSRDRGEADRARAILLTLSGWTSPRIAEAFSVREDTVRLWRSDFSRGGTDALKASVAPGPPPVKSETALRVVTPLLEEPVANRPNWTIARMRAEIEAREGVRISRSQLSKALRKKSSVTGGRGTR